MASTVSDPQDIITLGMYELDQLVVESSLIIGSLERSDHGSYTCTIINTLPETDTVSIVTDSTPVVVLGKECGHLCSVFSHCVKSFILYTLERPDLIQNVTVQAMGSHWALIVWGVPYNGNSEIMEYIVYIRNVQSDTIFTVDISSDSMRKRQAMSSHIISYNVTENILPAMLYQFTVVACNELGCGELGQPSPTILTDEDCKHS